MATKVAVVGSTGRMGGLVTRLLAESEDFDVHARIGRHDPIDRVEGADVVIDVSVPASSPEVVNAVLDRGIPIVVGTSGWTADRIAPIERRLAADANLTAFFIPNFSLGSVLATRFAELAAPHFGSIEIVEAHHAGKTDSPSGTAIRTAELIGAARADLGPVAAPHADQRARGQQVASVPVHSLRMAGIAARQEVIFGGTGETVRIIHETLSDESYEPGILLSLREATIRTGLIVGLGPLLGL
ncbi:MAG: 4-hydroxy-tetrahydrodipicolinate reductase [Pseudolysinimonas sp.]|uniref:4-hydroxy-tetrahydrodipicolinate reductase n=1 Tax=Pseudolysinimonas sp. TaxID=2680009 RepID=UPI003267D191